MGRLDGLLKLRDIGHQTSGRSSGWLLRAFPESSQLDIIVRAVLGTVLILGVEYVIEVRLLDLSYWQEQGSFIADPAVPLSAFALVFALILLGQWGQRYVELWAEVRPAFDVSDERYVEAVQHGFKGLYGKDYVPFGLFVVIQGGVYLFFGSDLPAGFLHIGFLHFFAAMAVYCFYRHIILIQGVSNLDLVGVSRARMILSEVADFSVVVCLNWFAVLVTIVIYLGFFSEASTLGIIYGFMVAVYIGIGFLVFIIPLVLLHDALVRTKEAELRVIDDEYEALFEGWREGTLEGDPSSGLDILETRRRNVENTSTWPYRLASVGKIVLSSVVPAAISVFQVFVG